MLRYHDTEWGVPVHRDQKMFEFLILESFQAGLSWRTVLHKRENFRRDFAQFDVRRVARFTPRDVQRLLNDAGIIRNRQKILAAINNAQRFLEVRATFGTFSASLWNFVHGQPVINCWQRSTQIPAVTPLAATIAADLKRRGFQFLGPTVVYAHLQAVGIVNDHLVSCWRHGVCS
jgi:DNA-3-methyladenine glycosylase I